MASESLRKLFLRPAFFAFTAAVTASACGGERRFPLRDPMTRDTDLDPVSIDCRAEPTKKDPSHVACAPEPYVSPLAWDGVDNSIFRPFAEIFAVHATSEAVNANALDEVAESAWFQNRIATRPMSFEEIAKGACSPEQMLIDAEHAPDGSWIIDKGKDNGATAGFRVKIPGKGKYMLKSDGPMPERPSAASVIGSAVYHAVGFNISCEQVIYIKRSALKLTPGLTVTDNTSITHPFDEAALEKVLESTAKKGEYLRFQASAWLDGRLLGPFRYEKTRDDDPNDVIDHRERRELRGGRLLAAWLDHFDAREQNTMDVWIAKNPAAGPDSSPGYVRHHYLDTSDCFGSLWDWDGISRRLGRSYLLDWGDIGLDFITLGIGTRSYERIQKEPGLEVFGYYGTKEFVAEDWVNEYPNPAFSRMTERDGAWMARILARFSKTTVRQLADLGRFADSKKTEYLAKVMEGRISAILERYLTRLSPLGDVHLESGALCAVDLAELREVRPASSFHHSAHLGGTPIGGVATPLTVTKSAGAKVCVTLPAHFAADGGSLDDAKERYFAITIEDGVAHPLVAYLYDVGPAHGFKLVGVDRPE